MNRISGFFCLLVWPLLVHADTVYDECILTRMAIADNPVQVETLRKECRALVENIKLKGLQPGALSRRFISERQTLWNRHTIMAHKQNYLLPYTHGDKVSRAVYRTFGDWADDLKHYEAKSQLSIKVPLTSEALFTKLDAIYIGFTIRSWWQVYSRDISAPFRETNYQPEIFYLSGMDWHPFGGNTGLTIGLEHQSNGRSQPLSRSWNRVFAGLIYEKDNFALSLRPWYRIKEDSKEDPNVSDGDDNPDIERYMGHFDLYSIYRWEKHELSLMWRNNLRSDNKGAIELGWSFPLKGHLKGYIQYFNGYGESLIDYNHSIERVGLGILLTDFL